MERKYVFPVGVAAVCLIAAQLMGPTQPQAQDSGSLFDVIERSSSFPISQASQAVAQEEPIGPGFVPAPAGNVSCDCEGCVSEAEVRSIVREELAKRSLTVAATTRETVSYGSAGSAVSSPTASRSYGSYVTTSAPQGYSQPVYQRSQPVRQVVRTGLLGRRVYSSGGAGTCQVVNGQMVCN